MVLFLEVLKTRRCQQREAEADRNHMEDGRDKALALSTRQEKSTSSGIKSVWVPNLALSFPGSET